MGDGELRAGGQARHIDIAPLQERWPHIEWEDHDACANAMTEDHVLISMSEWTETAFWIAEGVHASVSKNDLVIKVIHKGTAVEAFEKLLKAVERQASTWGTFLKGFQDEAPEPFKVKPIRNEGDLLKAFDRIEELWASKKGTPEGDELEVLAALVEDYEDEHHDLSHGDPVVLLEYVLKEREMSVEALSGTLGWGIEEVLDRKRELTLKEARQLMDVFKLKKGCFA